MFFVKTISKLSENLSLDDKNRNISAIFLDTGKVKIPSERARHGGSFMFRPFLDSGLGSASAASKVRFVSRKKIAERFAFFVEIEAWQPSRSLPRLENYLIMIFN